MITRSGAQVERLNIGGFDVVIQDAHDGAVYAQGRAHNAAAIMSSTHCKNQQGIREDQFAVTVWTDEHGHYHRTDGPALIKDDESDIVWYWHGWRHRLDGPAVESKTDGVEQYWVLGRRYNDMGRWAIAVADFKRRMEPHEKVTP